MLHATNAKQVPTLKKEGTHNFKNTSLRKKIVFLVEDDQDDIFFAEKKLQTSSEIKNIHTVKSAESLFGCLENFGAYESDITIDHDALILLDVHLPHSDGISALEKIRHHPMTEDIPVILLTGDISSKTVYDAYRLDANGYLEKPLNMDILHDLMSQIDF